MIKTGKNIFLYLVISSFILVSCHKEDTLFTSLPASATNIDFANNLQKKKMFNILYYLYYYNGGGVAVGDINNDGLADIYFTANNKGGNKLYLNRGNFKFEDITEKAGVAGTADWNTGVTMADVNGDGLLDIYVSTVSNKYGLKGHNELFINRGISPSPSGKGLGEVTFAEESEKYGLNTSCLTTQSAFFDYDRDGDLDCYILNQSHHPHSNIVDTANRRTYDTLSGDRLYRNDISTGGKFTDVSKQAGIFQSNLGYGLGIAVADINNDGWDDIYIGNDFHENDYYYVNNGPSPTPSGEGRGEVTFTESSAQHFRHYSRFSMGNDVADYNNDGQLDIVTVDMLPPDEKTLKTYGSDENPDIYKVKLQLHGYQEQYSKNSLQRNNGNGSSFSETSLMSGVAATDWSWSALFADFDNDGNKDLFVSSGIVKRPVDLDYIRFVSDLDMKKGRQETDKYDDDAIASMPDGSSHPYLFKNEGGVNFKDISAAWGTADLKGYYNGASYADLDNDGNLDIIINSLNDPAVILKNNAPPKNAMNISFKGNSLNSFGIGAKAWLFAAGKIQYQQLMLTRGFQSSVEPKLHFGSDSLRSIDSILIVWPDQKYQVLKNISSAGRLIVNQAAAAGIFNYPAFFPQAKPLFENITNHIGSNWKHIENDFLDYNKQYLIPHQLSTRGPKIAVADVNKDGLEDFYVCGASFQEGTLMIQSKDGRFAASALAVSGRMKATEETDAVFFDADNDGWPDLYVTSGGNEYDDGNPALYDNLYLNDGKGNFVQALNAIPKLLKNKSSVSAADVDKDGDIDLFVGGLSDAKQYGIAQSSYLLMNDGKAHFQLSGPSEIQLDNLGMVTGASFTDLNNDGWPDLVITGEWMPVKIFINNKGKFTATDIPQSTGLWQCIYTGDVNGDGFADILAGNWGHNSKLYTGKNGPLKLYIKDFDGNGSVEQVMAYTVNGKEYTFLAKDELERSLPVLKKAYLSYSEVAGKTVQYMFYDLFKDYIELKAETLSTCCFINNGKGNFTKQELPGELQLAPVFSFAPVSANGEKSFLGAGNFYGVIPYEGRYDALLPTAFNFNKISRNFQTVANIPLLDEEVRDMKWLTNKDGKKILIVAGNNKRLQFFKQAK
jgi:enediyne biosynthesis protein E4